MPSEKTTECLQLHNAYNNAVMYNAPEATRNKIKTQKDNCLQSMNDEEKYDFFRHQAVEISGLSHGAFDRQVTGMAGNDPSKKLAYTLTYLDAVASMGLVGIFGNPDPDIG